MLAFLVGGVIDFSERDGTSSLMSQLYVAASSYFCRGWRMGWRIEIQQRCTQVVDECVDVRKGADELSQTN